MWRRVWCFRDWYRGESHHRGTETQRHREKRSGVATLDDDDFGGREVVEIIDEAVDFEVGRLNLLFRYAAYAALDL